MKNVFPVLTILWMLLLGSCGVLAEETKPLTVDEAKFEMFKLYSKAKSANSSLRTKYPALRKADKLAREARREYSNAVRNDPALVEDFDKLDQRELSISEKLKLQKALFAKAETLTSLDVVRKKYNKARILALNEEIKAIRTEGNGELADGLAKILGRVKKP